jgi:hypothetical protein
VDRVPIDGDLELAEPHKSVQLALDRRAELGAAHRPRVRDTVTTRGTGATTERASSS